MIKMTVREIVELFIDKIGMDDIYIDTGNMDDHVYVEDVLDVEAEGYEYINGDLFIGV